MAIMEEGRPSKACEKAGGAVEDKLRETEFTLNKVPGVDNPADMLTKYVPAATYKKHLTAISIGPEEGRVGSAPQLTEGQLGMEETSTSDAESSTGQPNKEASSGSASGGARASMPRGP